MLRIIGTLRKLVPQKRKGVNRVLLFLVLSLMVVICSTAIIVHGTYFPLPHDALSAKQPSPEALASGLQVYAENCSICHQMDGSGMLRAQPPLVQDDYVMGNPERLIRVVLKGAVEIPRSRRLGYDNVMPGFGSLDDKAIADVLTYVRYTYGDRSSSITPEQVRLQRTANR
jgi:mono/diheme cytochrome c family protein